MGVKSMHLKLVKSQIEKAFNGIEENEAKYGLNPMKIYQYDFSGSSPTFIKKR